MPGVGVGVGVEMLKLLFDWYINLRLSLVIVLLYTCTSDGKKNRNLSMVLTANLSNIKCVTVAKFETIAIHMCIDASKIENGWPAKKSLSF